MKMLSACLMMLFATSCADIAATECGWVRLILPSKNDFLTRGTMVQIIAHNRNVEVFCRKNHTKF